MLFLIWLQLILFIFISIWILLVATYLPLFVTLIEASFSVSVGLIIWNFIFYGLACCLGSVWWNFSIASLRFLHLCLNSTNLPLRFWIFLIYHLQSFAFYGLWVNRSHTLFQNFALTVKWEVVEGYPPWELFWVYLLAYHPYLHSRHNRISNWEEGALF